MTIIITPVLQKLKWLTVEQNIEYKDTIQIFKHMNTNKSYLNRTEVKSFTSVLLFINTPLETETTWLFQISEQALV